MGKIAVFGGTFNPVHIGHVRLAEAFDQALHFDKILIIPTSIPPHKFDEYLAPAEMRMEMCRLAFAHMKNTEVSDIELKRGGKSYSYYTILRLGELYPSDELYFLMGSDMFLSLTTWFNYEKLKKLCVFCAAAREKQEYDRLLQQKAVLECGNARCFVLPVRETAVSSTEIREKLAKRLPVDCILPQNVLNYICEQHLYTI